MRIDRRSTRTDLIRLLRQHGGATLNDLQRATGLSRSALRQHLTVLERDGLIQEQLVRGKTGRPPIVYQLAPAGRGSPQGYATLLAAVLRAAGDQGQEQLDRIVEAAVAQIAAQHQDIARIPGDEARIRAALAVLLGDAEAGDVRRVGPDYEVILRTCPLDPAAMEFHELCDISRRLLAALVGAEVEQRESIVRGDPWCSFLLKIPHAGLAVASRPGLHPG